jgi:hypothetical protein
MPLWGANIGAEKKPSWLTNAQKRNCYATNSGWVYKDPNTGIEELLVAIGGLIGSNNSTGIGGPNITEVYITNRTSNSDPIVFNVVFNELVVINDDYKSNTVIALTANNDGSWAGNTYNGYGIANYTSGNGTNTLVFTYTPASGDDMGNVEVLGIYLANTTANTVAEANTEEIVQITDVSSNTVMDSYNFTSQGSNGSVNVTPDLSSEYIIKA